MFKLMKISTVCLLIITSCFFVLSKIIFDKVYLTSKNIIDEEFHLPLGQAYCKYDFDKWDNKVTTLPGLYLISALILGRFELCSVYWLRFISLGFSVLNLILYNALLNASNRESRWKNIVAAVNLSLIPPIYFLGHLYYTDVVSLTMVLLSLYFFKRCNHYCASFFGLLSVLMRQTNVIYVGMVFILFLLKEVSKQVPKKFQNLDSYEFTFEGLKLFVARFIRGCILTLKTAPLNFWLDCCCYSIVLVTFVLFVVWNGSIVVGDKTAHQATLHVPQIFYFSLFCLFFAWPYFLKEVGSFIRHLVEYKLFVLTCTLFVVLAVYFNTQVHPYLLADNRHYIFYIWNRFYGKYVFFRYLIIPVYIFSLYAIISKLCYSTNLLSTLIYLICISAVLMPQKLIELRYFFVPYIYFRIHIRNVTKYQLFFEFLTYTILNVLTFYLFFTKTIEWADFQEPQRLIW